MAVVVCAICRGHGTVLRMPDLALNAADGTRFDVPLHGLGIHNTYLRPETRIAS